MSDAPLRIVLADDHTMVRLGLSMLLAELDGLVVVGEAVDGPSAVALCRQVRPDVLLLDLALPGFDGLEVLRRVMEEGTVGAALILTSLAQPEQVRAALRIGARGFLYKDTDGERLGAAIRGAAGGQTVLHPEAQAALFGVQPAEDPDPGAALTPREREVLQALAAGRSNKEIAASLGLTVGTVKVYVTHILAKLGVDDRTQAALWAHRRGINQS